jgi:hypothetical protein
MSLLQKFENINRPDYVLRFINLNGKHEDFFVHKEATNHSPVLKELLESACNDIQTTKRQRKKAGTARKDRLVRIIDFNVQWIPAYACLLRNLFTTISNQHTPFELFLKHLYATSEIQYTCPLSQASKTAVCTDVVNTPIADVLISTYATAVYFKCEEYFDHIKDILCKRGLFTFNTTEIVFLRQLVRNDQPYYILLSCIMDVMWDILDITGPCCSMIMNDIGPSRKYIVEGSYYFSGVKCHDVLQQYLNQDKFCFPTSGFMGEWIATDSLKLVPTPWIDYMDQIINFSCKRNPCCCQNRNNLILERVKKTDIPEFRLTFALRRDLRLLDHIHHDRETLEIIRLHSATTNLSISFFLGGPKQIQISISVSSLTAKTRLPTCLIQQVNLCVATLNVHDGNTLMSHNPLLSGGCLLPDYGYTNTCFSFSKDNKGKWINQSLTNSTKCNIGESQNITRGKEYHTITITLDCNEVRDGENISDWDERLHVLPNETALVMPPRCLFIKGSVKFRNPNISPC